MLTLHLNAVKERSPLAIVTTRRIDNGELCFKEENLPGDWYRVFPATGRDVQFLQFLEHHLDKFAPANGGGTLVHPRALTIKPR